MTDKGGADEFSELAVEEVAKALYMAQVDHAKESIDAIPFDVDDLPLLFERLKTETQTAQVLIFGSYLEDRIQALFRTRLFHIDSDNVAEELFGAHGPLDSFGSRIMMAYHLGWLSPEQKRKLSAFQKIRNSFAHRAFKVSFSDADIASRLALIRYDNAPIIEAAKIGSDTPELFPSYDSVTAEQRYLCDFAMLFTRTFEEFLVLPAALAYSVSPDSIMAEYEKSPETMRKLYRAAAKAMLLIVKHGAADVAGDD